MPCVYTCTRENVTELSSRLVVVVVIVVVVVVVGARVTGRRVRHGNE